MAVELTSGIYEIKPNVFILTQNDDAETLALASQFSLFLSKELELTTHINTKPATNDYSSIVLTKNEAIDPLNIETYSLSINDEVITINGMSSHGIFNGIQTLKQLMVTRENAAELPQLVIEDQPRFNYRGMMLDVSRHFFTVDEVKRFLDVMALYKMNKFHWHLTDDQGWRIEIKQYPLLTHIGSYREESMLEKNYDPYIGDGIPHSGFYTQAQIKDIVSYAQDRFIEVIPEIDMPGHSLATLAAYPELGCYGFNYQVATSWWESRGVLCPTESTFEFVESMLDEIVELFPSQYIHIGGDEVSTNIWRDSKVAQQLIIENNLENEHALQGYFFDRVSQYLSKKGKQVIGWDEVLEKNIQSRPTVMIWRDLSLLSEAEELSTPVILAPEQYTYFDYYQDKRKTEPLAQCCLLTLKEVYRMPLDFPEHSNVNVHGGQGQLWTAFIKTETHLQYMAFPRMFALSEALWSNESTKSYPRFKRKIIRHQNYLDAIGVNYRRSD